MSKEFWQQSFPRIISVLLGISFFIFILLDIFVRNREFSNYHYWFLISAVALILATMASRLRIFNFVDFNSRLDELKQFTERQFTDIKQQIFNSFNQNIAPSQNISTKIIFDTGSIDKNILKLSDFKTEYDDSSYSRDTYLKRAYAYRLYAGTLLQIARMFQIVITQNRIPEVIGSEVAAENRKETRFERFLSDDKMLTLSNKILDDGVDHLFPFKVPDDSDLTMQKTTEDTKSTLHLLPSFIETYQKVSKGEVEHPSFKDAEGLFDNLSNGLGNLRVAIILLGSHSLLSNYRFHTMLNDLKKELQPETENK